MTNNPWGSPLDAGHDLLEILRIRHDNWTRAQDLLDADLQDKLSADALATHEAIRERDTERFFDLRRLIRAWITDNSRNTGRNFGV